MIGEQGDSNNSDLPQDEDESAKLLSKYRRQARKVIENIDCESYQGRKNLASSYRKINKMINDLQKDKFNLNEEPDQLEDILKCAFFYRAYEMNDPNRKYLSSFCKEAVKSNRRLKIPFIQVQDEVVGINQKYIRLNSNKQEFTLTIKAEPSSGILYTNIPNSHPLLIDQNQLKPPYFRRYAERQVQDILTTPCDISIVAVSDSKIESKVVTLKVTSQINERELRHTNMGYAIRPAQTFPFDQSAFGSSQSASFINAQDFSYQQNQ